MIEQPTTTLPTCARCHQPITAPYPTRIVGQPYHQACAREAEAERAGLLACLHCLGLFTPDECVLAHGEHAIYCIECWSNHYPHEDATLMSVVIAEQQQGAEK